MANSFRSLNALSLRLPSLPKMRSRMCASVSAYRFLRTFSQKLVNSMW